MNNGFAIDREKIADFCRRNHIIKLSLFGSVRRDDFGPESDVDVLVEFAPDARVGLIRLASLEIELSGIIGRKADLRTSADLSRYFRDKIVSEAEVQYAACQATMGRLDYVETLEAIKQGLEEAERGESRPASEVFAELSAKYSISR